MFKQSRTPVAQAINPDGSKVTPLAFVRFNNAKTTDARAMSETETAHFERGEELGYASVENDVDWRDALRACKANTDRVILRAGFVSARRAASGCDEKSAKNRFDYLARMHAPAKTSRQAKANKAKAGRRTKAQATVEKLSEKTVAARLVAVLAYVAQCQQEVSDEDTLTMLGTIAKLANGAKTK